eukprot:TRINITY_DN1859_c0_g2_i2.p3 TRINITY_DN1859_c0_g2~~TRINITY_DN1859_c0_g2_i2.p3  ORF type:complete len:144 (+),score=26.37 TRINITY_DN1859_c0_g2_i2:686-1117(+)
MFAKSTFALEERHTAGVCMVKDIDAQAFLTASYDGFVRVWDMRKLSPRCIAQVRVGDQCWDFVLKDNGKDFTLAASCIYDAACLVNLTKEWNVIGKEKFEKHKSIVYGVDFFGDPKDKHIVTCSFYDKTLYTWTLNNCCSMII